MKLAFIHAEPSKHFSARLTEFFTGSTAYHCGFVDEAAGAFFDMNLLPRKCDWPRYDEPGKWVELYEVPGLTREICERLLQRDSVHRYGFVDYLLFGLRWAYHLVGKSTRNAGGLICSELCALWLREVGFDAPAEPVPSPADLVRWASENLHRAD